MTAGLLERDAELRRLRETLYFADPFPAPDWRRPYAAEGAADRRRGDLPAHVAAGQ